MKSFLKYIIFSIILLLIAEKGFCQQALHAISFVHVGTENYPIGTIVISVEKLIHPNNKPMDSVFGVGIKTDIRTFKKIRDAIRSDKYDISNQKQIRAVTDYFRIEDLDGFVLEIHAPYYQMFFRELRAELTKEKCDPKVLEALRYY